MSLSAAIDCYFSVCCQVFEVFDTKKNDVIGFDEFVKAVSVFHPNAPLSEKADCESPLSSAYIGQLNCKSSILH